MVIVIKCDCSDMFIYEFALALGDSLGSSNQAATYLSNKTVEALHYLF